MSHRDSELDELFRAAREEPVTHRWQDQHEVFRRLGLGGSAALFFARLAHAFALRPLSRTVGGAVGLTLVVSAAAVGAHLASSHRASPTPALAAPAGAPSTTATDAPSRVAEEAAAIAAVSVHALPSAVAEPPASADVHRRAPSASSQARPASSAADDSLARELASVSKIRAKIAARDYAGARAATTVHRASFPQGVLAQEVEVLEIEALRGLEDPRACAVGKAFVDAHPTSPHRDRVLGLTSSCNP